MRKQRDISLGKMNGVLFKPSQEFESTFPALASLLRKATVIDFVAENNQSFRQYIWTHKTGCTTGWLCRMEHQRPQDVTYISEHLLLAKQVGGIIHYWCGHENDVLTVIDNNNFTFTLKDCTTGLGGHEDYYYELCEEEAAPLDISKFTVFALEANGDITLYNTETKQVYVFLPGDYSPFEFTPVEGQPLGTFYKYDRAETFVEFVELLAKQWLEIIK